MTTSYKIRQLSSRIIGHVDNRTKAPVRVSQGLSTKIRSAIFNHRILLRSMNVNFMRTTTNKYYIGLQ
jgi:hypothetical protein